MELQFKDPYGKDLSYSYAYNCIDSCGFCRFEFSRDDVVMASWMAPGFERMPYCDLDLLSSMTFHRSCFLIIGGGRSAPTVAAATYPGRDFEGYHHLQHRRHRWLKDTFSRILFQALRGRLPLEVCRTIAEHSTRERAIQAFQRHLPRYHSLQPGNISIPIHCGVTLWAQYVVYEGDRYIRSFSYASRGGDEDIVLDWNTAEKLLNVFIRHNGLGVNKLIRNSADWSCTQGIKLRGLGIVKSPDSFVEFSDDGPRDIRWAIPPAPVKHSPKIPLPNGLDTQFVRAFDWNKPGTLGYSFLVLGDAFLRINSHQAGSPPASEDYCLLDRPKVARLYLAMSPGESVAELWIRTYHKRLSTLIVVTSFGRSLVVGPENYEPGATYHAIAELPQNKPCRMFYAESYSKSIGWLHSDSVSTWQLPEKRQIHPEERQIDYPWTSLASALTARELWLPSSHYTSAKLDDVREITPCKFWQTSFFVEGEKITGLLLTYADGSRASVGEIRPDKLGTPVAVASVTMFLRYKGPYCEGPDTISRVVDYGLDWFGFSEPLVSDSPVEESDHTDTEPLEDEDESDVVSSEESDSGFKTRYTNIMAVPMNGRLDWSFRAKGNYILSHHKFDNPKHEMRHILSQHATITTEDPVVKSLTNLVGNVSPNNLESVYHDAERTGNHQIFGL
ncbi:hypothetical protein FNAPI_4702 [Fusarium napiforme]|uniref:Uncharacterized protein n=1 Tax=Fusarium napiforme TaxID=42672 RepID=A0A8H5JQB7_9HYPO|nr:hypothetical protein FNAPI_4702 [Fusarium napiforme]